MRRTVMALTAAGVLFASACGQEDSQTATADPAANAAAESASASRRVAQEAEAATSTTSTTTPSTTSTTVDSSVNQVITSGSDAASAEAPCGDGSAPQALRSRPADAPPPPECSGPTAEPVLGTGDVQVTLRWESSADVDLHVFEPDGTEIWFGGRGPTSTGGQLDVDSNVGCEQEASVENVFWPTGQSPDGEYTIEVNGYQVDGCGSGEYTLTAKVQGEEVLVEAGEVGEDETDTYTIEV